MHFILCGRTGAASSPVDLGVSENKGTLFWGPYNKDPTIWGTILGSPVFGKSHLQSRSAGRLIQRAEFGRSATLGLGFRKLRSRGLGVRDKADRLLTCLPQACPHKAGISL